MNFFSHVEYSSRIPDNSWTSMAETVANRLREPHIRVNNTILSGEFRKIPKRMIVSITNRGKLIKKREKWELPAAGLCSLFKDACLMLPGAVLAIPFMGFAYLNEEIRLKHRFAEGQLSTEEEKRYYNLIKARLSPLSKPI